MAIPVAWASAVVAIGVIPSFMVGALAVQIRSEIDLTSATLGLLVGLFFGCAAVASGPVGRLVQRVGAWRGMQAAAVGSAMCLSGIALLAHDVLTLAILLIVGGLANSAANPAANFLLVGAVPSERRGLALGVKQAAIPIATLIAGLSVPVFALTLGWRWAFGAAALVALACVGFGMASSLGRRPLGHQDREGEPVLGAISKRARRDLVLLAIAAALGIWGGQAMGTFLVSYAVHLGLAPASAGLLLAIASIAGITARIVGGWVVDRRRATGVGELKAMFAAGAAGLLLVAVGLPDVLWLGSILAFAGGWGWSGVLTYVAIRSNPGAPAAATGITQSGVFLGATLGVPLFGVLVESTSYQTAWIATAVSLVLGLFIVFRVGRRLVGSS
jgi:predicted MFS family arabinose efflux permease